MIAIHLCAPNNSMGNPRRGYMIIKDDGYAEAFIKEGYLGPAAVRQAGYDDCLILGDDIKIPPIEYRRLCKLYPDQEAVVTDITEIHNPAAVGFRWQAPESSTLYELAWARGTTGFMFGVRPGQQGSWHATRVTNPRFQPANLKEARAMAQDFADAGAAEAVTW